MWRRGTDPNGRSALAMVTCMYENGDTQQLLELLMGLLTDQMQICDWTADRVAQVILRTHPYEAAIRELIDGSEKLWARGTYEGGYPEDDTDLQELESIPPHIPSEY